MSRHNIPFLNMKKKNTESYYKSAAMGFFQGTQKRVRKSRGKRAISVQATIVLLYHAGLDIVNSSAIISYALQVLRSN